MHWTIKKLFVFVYLSTVMLCYPFCGDVCVCVCVSVCVHVCVWVEGVWEGHVSWKKCVCAGWKCVCVWTKHL